MKSGYPSWGLAESGCHPQRNGKIWVLSPPLQYFLTPLYMFNGITWAILVFFFNIYYLTKSWCLLSKDWGNLSARPSLINGRARSGCSLKTSTPVMFSDWFLNKLCWTKYFWVEKCHQFNILHIYRYKTRDMNSSKISVLKNQHLGFLKI